MPSVSTQTPLQLARTVALSLVLSLAAAYGIVGPRRVHAIAAHILAKTARAVHGRIASAELQAAEDCVFADRQTLQAASCLQDEVRLRVNNLIELRNDLLSREKTIHSRLVPLKDALHQSGRHVVQIDGRVYRRNDVDLRLASLEREALSLEQEIADTELAISRLRSQYGLLDHRISQTNEQIDARERRLLLSRYRLEGELASADMLDRLDSLDRSNNRH